MDSFMKKKSLIILKMDTYIKTSINTEFPYLRIKLPYPTTAVCRSVQTCILYYCDLQHFNICKSAPYYLIAVFPVPFVQKVNIVPHLDESFP